MVIPSKVGVMVLPGMILLPGAMLPLYIFEPRYREMLEEALKSNRVFAVAHEADPASGRSIGSAGLIRACVANADGTSHLILQGIGRVRFLEWFTGHSFYQARVEMLPAAQFDRMAAERLRAEIRDLCLGMGKQKAESFRKIEQYMDGMSDVAEFSDLAAAAMVTEPSLRQRLLEDADVTSRLTILLAYLKEMRDGL